MRKLNNEHCDSVKYGERYSSKMAESLNKKTDTINSKYFPTQKNKSMHWISSIAGFGVGILITIVRIIARISIIIPFLSFWLIVILYFEEGLGNIGMYFEVILNTSLSASVLYVVLNMTLCFMFGHQCSLIHENLHNIR